MKFINLISKMFNFFNSISNWICSFSIMQLFLCTLAGSFIMALISVFSSSNKSVVKVIKHTINWSALNFTVLFLCLKPCLLQSNFWISLFYSNWSVFLCSIIFFTAEFILYKIFCYFFGCICFMFNSIHSFYSSIGQRLIRSAPEDINDFFTKENKTETNAISANKINFTDKQVEEFKLNNIQPPPNKIDTKEGDNLS